jgi:FMN-binding domain
MKRLILAVAGTIAGLIALLSFRTHPGPAAVGSLPAATLGPVPSLVTPPARTGAAPVPGPAPASAGPVTVTTLGQTVHTQYDTIQVRIVTVGGQIQSVAFAKLAGDEQLSDLINAHAGPLLLQRTLTAQSADIDAVSGATYTSDAYRESLQSALDQAAGQ